MSFEFYQQGAALGYTEEMSYRAGVTSQINTLTTDISTINSEITALEQMTGSVDLSALTTTDKTSLVGAINENVTNIATNASNIATNTSNITTNTTNIATNATNITKNTNDINYIATANAANFASLQAAHDYITANFTHGVLLIPNDMTITDTFHWDVKKVTLLGYGVVLNFNINDTSKYAIETTSSETVEPYYQSTTYAQGIKFRGTNKTCNGFKFVGTTTLNSPSHIALRNCEISYFNKGIDFSDHAYAITFYDCDIFRNTIAVNFDAGHTDAGEKLGFINCMIYNNATAIRNYADGWINFVNCSVDYNTECVIDINVGKLAFTNCHIEHRASWFNSSNRPFKLANDYTLLQITNSLILFTSGESTTMDYVFDNSSTGKGGVFITDCYIAGATTTTGFLATGTGYMQIKGTKTAVVEGTAPRTSSAMNLLKDGGFESTSMQDEVFISSDTAAITTRTLTGTNAILTLDATQYKSGSKSLKFNKANGSGSNSGFTIQVPISRGSLIGYQLFYKKVGSQTGTMVISHGFCKKGLDDVIFKKSEVGAQSVVFTSSTVDWTDSHSNTAGRPRCPSWATHFYIDVNCFSMNAGDIFFDDVTITEM